MCLQQGVDCNPILTGIVSALSYKDQTDDDYHQPLDAKILWHFFLSLAFLGIANQLNTESSYL